MAIEAGFAAHELDELAVNMYRTAQERYPAEVKKFLRTEGNIARKELRAQTSRSTKKKTGNLLKGIKRSKVTKYNGDFQIRVFNSAYHAHLLEYGHVEVVWGNRTENYVPGKHMFDKTAAAMDRRFAGDVEDFLDKMLSEGLGL